MSGRLESFAPTEIGAPLLVSSKWVPPTRRETKICFTLPRSSSHTTHGTVAFAGFIVPAATRGSSADLLGSLFKEHCSSFVADSAQVPKWFVVPDVSRVALS